MALVGFNRSVGTVLTQAQIWAAGEQLVSDGQKTTNEVATAGSSTSNSDAAREITGFSNSFINTIITNSNLGTNKAQEILNATDINRDNLSAVSAMVAMLIDDFDDNKFSSSRDNRSTSPSSYLASTQFGQKYRPQWTNTGDATVTASGGNLHVSGGTLRSGTADHASITYDLGNNYGTGTWKCRFKFQNALTGDNPCLMMPNYYDDNNNYFMRVRTGAKAIDIVRKRAGSNAQQLTTGTVNPGTSYHTVTFTRDRQTNITLSYDGTQMDSGTDNNFGSFGKIALGGGGGNNTVDYDYLQYTPA